MDPREQRAIILAAMCKIDRKDGHWLVPSQSEPNKKYKVTLDGEKGHCDCPDYENGFCCKHVRSVRITLKRELGMDGSITETREILFQEKKTYKQVWPAYNLAQKQEKHRFQVLLADLCKDLPDPDTTHKRGPKPHKMRDAIFAMVYKVYTGFSSRRCHTDIQEAHKNGFMTRAIPGPKVTWLHENPTYTPILKSLVGRSAAPLAEVETEFAVDSTGFATTRYETWMDHKHGSGERRKCMWVKVHIACGVKTNCITAVEILGKSAADCPQFKPLVAATSKRFQINQVSADKAYLSAENVEQVHALGGTPFILPKANTTGGVGGLFEKMVAYFQFRQDEFLLHYHRRSNVESTFSAVKRKFGDSVRSKTDTAMTNEVLCKLICQNLCCLIQEQAELGIEPVFWPEAKEECPVVATVDAPLAMLPPPEHSLATIKHIQGALWGE